MMYRASFVIFLTTISAHLDLSLYRAPFSADPWDVDGPCQEHVERFSKVQANMVQCATNWSIPPKVCTNCFEQYIAFKQVEYETKHLDKIFSLDNRTCTQVIYDNYLLSYSHDISEALTSNIWAKSRCDSCLTITWNLTANDSRVEFVNQTVKFQEKLYIWRDCVANVTGGDLERDNNSICRYCKHQFNDLFAYYWNIYVEPGIDFCVDVETTVANWSEPHIIKCDLDELIPNLSCISAMPFSEGSYQHSKTIFDKHLAPPFQELVVRKCSSVSQMNDTVHIWNDVWECAERKDRKRDSAAVLVTTAALLSITVIFYASSYIQGGGQARVFVRYSRREPQEQRSSLLTPSASLNNMGVYSIRNLR